MSDQTTSEFTPSNASAGSTWKLAAVEIGIPAGSTTPPSGLTRVP
jgi:hypothetical protein